MKAVLDCGTTNTKCYIINDEGTLLAEGYSRFGVKDNALKQDREDYKKDLKLIVANTVSKAGLSMSNIKVVIAFGMISSDLGLMVLPHAEAPVGIADQQRNIQILDTSLFGNEITFCLIRGIKNPLEKEKDLQNVFTCDFMRGEETQVAGIIEKYKPMEDFNVIMFSSHLKIIHVSSDMKIQRSMTTMSGQIFDCIVNNTVVGKSVMVHDAEKQTMSNEQLIQLAEDTVEQTGLMRAFLLPRFMESFTEMTSMDRLIYLDAILALEDLKAIKEYYGEGRFASHKYYFIGQKTRCEMFAGILKKKCSDTPIEIEIIDGKEKNREISILGALKLTENC